MKLFSSLKNRIFLASTVVAVLSIGFAMHFVTNRMARDVEAEIRRGLQEAGALVEKHHAARLETLTLMAHLVADLPKLKAAVATEDPPTVLPLAVDYKERVKSDLFAVAGRQGAVLAALRSDDGTLQIVNVPIEIGAEPPDVLGTLSLGFALNDGLAAQFKAVTASEVAIALEGRIIASTLPDAYDGELAQVLRSDAITSVSLGGDEYVAAWRPLPGPPGGAAPAAIVLRSRTERLSFLHTLRTALGVAALVAAVLAVLLSYAVARTVTRPLATITSTMREMSATGDFTGKIRLEGAGGDEDARLLARTFNALTDSITSFQRDAALRERLSALGRLSTVIAHEIRNPLMIVKGSLRALRRAGLPEEVQEAAADIDQQVARLDHIVDDVLDFARPLRVDLAPTDLNTLCRDAARATLTRYAGTRLEMSLDPAAAAVVTDAERLRTVLVNILTNAGAAVAARTSPPPPPDIEIRTQALSAARIAIEVEDRGVGVDPADLPHLFEPYFSTRRTGTGLGLAIAKNIVDCLGGTITALSRPGAGTQIRIELPTSPAHAGGPR